MGSHIQQKGWSLHLAWQMVKFWKKNLWWLRSYCSPFAPVAWSIWWSAKKLCWWHIRLKVCWWTSERNESYLWWTSLTIQTLSQRSLLLGSTKLQICPLLVFHVTFLCRVIYQSLATVCFGRNWANFDADDDSRERQTSLVSRVVKEKGKNSCERFRRKRNWYTRIRETKIIIGFRNCGGRRKWWWSNS